MADWFLFMMGKSGILHSFSSNRKVTRIKLPTTKQNPFFDKHKEEYYNGLLDVSQKNKWREWVKFFLRAFAEQADETIKNIQKLLDLQKNMQIF